MSTAHPAQAAHFLRCLREEGYRFYFRRGHLMAGRVDRKAIPAGMMELFRRDRDEIVSALLAETRPAFERFMAKATG